MVRWGDFKKLIYSSSSDKSPRKQSPSKEHESTPKHSGKISSASAVGFEMTGVPKQGFAGCIDENDYEMLEATKLKYEKANQTHGLAFVDSDDPDNICAAYNELEKEIFKRVFRRGCHLNIATGRLEETKASGKLRSASSTLKDTPDSRDLDKPLSELDCQLLRFLRARTFDPTETFKMIDNYLAWRQRARVDQICRYVRFPWVMELRQIHPHGYHGVDRIGRPIYIDCVGKSNIAAALKMTTLEHLCAYWTQQYEYLRRVILPACSIAAGRRIEQGVSIVDLNGLNLSHAGKKARKVMINLASLGQNCFPELLGCMVIVNAPVLFGSLWSLIKVLIDESSVSKITVLTRSTSDWKGKLQKLADPSQLPEFLGGNLPDEGWHTNSFGPWKDEKILSQVKERYPEVPDSLLSLDLTSTQEQALSLLEGIALQDASGGTAANTAEEVDTEEEEKRLEEVISQLNEDVTTSSTATTA